MRASLKDMRGLVCVLISLGLLSGVAFAHTISFNELLGVELCVEPRSVQVAISDKTETLELALSTRIRELLEKDLFKTLDQYDIPYQQKTDCSKDKGFVYVLYFSNWGQDTNGVPYLVHAASVQVGGVPEAVIADFELLLPNLKFENYYSALLFEDELPNPIFEGLAEANQEMIVELATSWWESFELLAANRAARQQLYLRYGLAASVLLTSLVVAIGVALSARKRGQRQKPNIELKV